MTCESCGAEVRTLDTTCGSCGAALLTIPPVPATPSVPTREPVVAQPSTRGKRSLPKPKASLVVTAIAVLVAIGLSAGLFVVNGTLATTRSDAATTSSQLTAANEQARSLQQRVQTLEGGQSDLEKQLETTKAEASDTRASLDACQGAFQLAADINTGGITASKLAQLQSKLAACFEGKIPPSVFR